MCIGIPMRVLSLDPGHAHCYGRGDERRVRTALVGEVAIGDWLLVFIDSAQEIISDARALEINGTLDLIEVALLGLATHSAAPHDATTMPVAFDLPSGLNTSGKTTWRRSPPASRGAFHDSAASTRHTASRGDPAWS